MSKVVGIIGGMGPQSTIDLMERVVAYTPVSKEQEHIRILVDNRPQIPDRTDYLLGKGPSPLPMLIDSGCLLQSCGADFLAIACNTAHAFIDQLQAAVHIPVLNMLELLFRHLEQHVPAGRPLLLLTTTGALKIGLFDKYLSAYPILLPPAALQRNILMKAIYGKKGVKTGVNLQENREKILKVVYTLLREKPAVIIAGCTEIGLCLRGVELEVEIVDPLDILARKIVQYARI